MKEINEAVKKKLEKIAALARNAGTPAEAAVAMKKAKEICDKNGVDFKDIHAGNYDLEEVTLYSCKKSIRKWRILLALAVASFYDCQCVTKRGYPSADIAIRGFTVDVYVASEMYNYIVKSIEMSISEYDGRIDKNYFRLGYIRIISEKLDELKCKDNSAPDTRASENHLMVLKKETVDHHYNDATPAKPIMIKQPDEFESLSAQAGMEEGSKLNLNKQIKKD